MLLLGLLSALLLWGVFTLQTRVFEPASKARHQSLITVEEAEAMRTAAAQEEEEEATAKAQAEALANQENSEENPQDSS